MALIIDIRINDRVISRVACQRILRTYTTREGEYDPWHPHPDDVHMYAVESGEFDQKTMRWEFRERGTLDHRYGDGATVLARKALEHVETNS